MYVRYVYKLYNIHIACGNHTEAALTLQLHAELLDWTDDALPPSLSDSHMEQRLKWQGKEAIYLRIIEEFDRGKVWCSIVCVDQRAYLIFLRDQLDKSIGFGEIIYTSNGDVKQRLRAYAYNVLSCHTGVMVAAVSLVLYFSSFLGSD
jgi:hypothetical protein